MYGMHPSETQAHNMHAHLCRGKSVLLAFEGVLQSSYRLLQVAHLPIERVQHRAGTRRMRGVNANVCARQPALVLELQFRCSHSLSCAGAHARGRARDSTHHCHTCDSVPTHILNTIPPTTPMHARPSRDQPWTASECAQEQTQASSVSARAPRLCTPHLAPCATRPPLFAMANQAAGHTQKSTIATTDPNTHTHRAKRNTLTSSQPRVHAKKTRPITRNGCLPNALARNLRYIHKHALCHAPSAAHC